MRWAIAVAGLVLGACGPSVTGDDAQTSAAGSSGDVASSTSAAGGSSDSGTTVIPTSVSITDPTPMSSTGDDSSTGAPEFSDDQVLGGWLCEGEGPPFYMEVDGYMSPYDVTGSVCVEDGRNEDPTDWVACGDLTVHPNGGGPILWIYAVFNGPPGNFSVMLVYDPATDVFTGMWSGPGSEALEGAAVSCARYG